MPAATSTTNKDGTRTQGSRILSLVQQWQEMDHDYANDCAIVSQYYSGQIAESPEDQDTLGLVDHANFGVGKAGLQQAKDETLAAFTKPKRLISVSFKKYPGTETEKLSDEDAVMKGLDKLLREWDFLFIPECTTMTDRHVMHGDAIMMFPPEDEGWRPFHARILTDPDAPQNPHDDNFTRWAVYSDLQIGEALSGIAKGVEGWSGDAEKFIRGQWERRYDSVDAKSGTKATFVSTFDDMLAMVEYVSPEEWSSQGQIGLNLYEFYNSRFRCFFYYQKDFSNPEKGIPVDLYIIARVQPKLREDDEYYDGDPLLYSQKGAYSKVGHAIADFVLDTKLGVDTPSWSTILGLGHTNYNLDRWSNLLQSALVNNAIDKSTALLAVEDSSDVRMMEKYIQDGYRANSILPAGASFVDKSKFGISVDEGMSMLTFLQNQANGNAVGYTGQTHGKPGELRVEAANRQQGDLRTASNRGVQFSQKVRVLMQEVGRRIIRELRLGHYFGRAEEQINMLREELKRKGVDMSVVHEDNINFNYSRLIGDGDPAQRQARVNTLVERIGLIPATARNGVLQAWFAETTDDWELAERVFENEEIEQPGQESKAISKAAEMMVLGVHQVVTKDDVPEAQLKVIIPILDGISQRAIQAGQFKDMQEIAGFTAIGQYAILLAQELEGRGQRDLASTYVSEIQRISTEAQEPLQNFLNAEQARQDPELEMKAAEMQLKAQKADLDERQFQHKQSKDIASQQTRNRKEQFQEVVQTRRVINEEERLQLEKLKADRENLDRQIAQLNG